jgi:hypothetical protein
MRSDNLRVAPPWITPDLVKRVLDIAMPVGGESMPIATVPTPGVKPRLAIVPKARTETPKPPVTHSRRPEEREAAITGPASTASPLRTTEPSSAGRGTPSAGTGAASHPVDAAPARKLAREAWLANRAAQRKAETEAWIEADRPAFQIAFDRGIAIADLARALRQHQATVLVHTKQAGFVFGRREPLADPLTLEQLLALADPGVPVPELRKVRLKRERLARWAKIRRDERAADVERRRAERTAAAERREAANAEARRQREIERAAAQAAKSALNRNTRGASGTAREAPSVASSGATTRSSARAPFTEPAPISPARAQPIIVQQTPGAPRCISYAERMTAAIAHLRARNFVVQRHNRDELIARWHISGWNGLFSNEQLVQLAQHHGLELRA